MHVCSGGSKGAPDPPYCIAIDKKTNFPNVPSEDIGWLHIIVPPKWILWIRHW